MKAQILKIAGVKNEKEFYKKFPTEEAFMKKHGKALKKAQVGAIIGAKEEEAPMQKPIMYDDLASGAQASVYGISPEEQKRREALASQQAIADASGQGGRGGLADIFGSIDPAMISQLVGGAKNGKMLKKAQDGLMGKPFQGMPKTPTKFSVPSTGGFNTDVSKNPYMSGSLIGGKKGNSAQSTSGGEGFDWKGKLKEVSPQIASQAAPVIGAYQEIKQNKKDLAKSQMYGKVSDITLQAASSRAEQPTRRYVRPEDQVMQNFKPLGTGTNYLAAANGTMIGGNPTEIQNMYTTPNTMYTDLGFEPLNDANKVKNFKKGGKLNKAAGGVTLDSFSGQGGGLGGMLGSKVGGGSGQGGPGSTIGSAIGGIAGSFIPIPGVGTFLGSTVGGFLGGLFDGGQQNQAQAAQDKLNQNLQNSAFQSGTQNLQMQNKAFMEDGGWVSHDWQPQVIAKFGDADVSQVHAFAQDGMPQYRAGGHLKEYTPPSAAAMYTGRAEYGVQMAMGGDLEVHRGEAETMSYNPYLPGDGETIMFRGPSHDNGGMPVSFGNNGVEVEGGEPAIKMKDGGKQENLVVYGNMMIPDYGVNEINDPKAKGKKFKHYIADLSKQEAKINKSVEKGVELVNNYDTGNEFDQLAFNSGQAMMIGGDLKLKTIAERKMDTAAVQNAILDTAEEYGLESDALARGNMKQAKFGGKFSAGEMFQGGGKKGKGADTSVNAFVKSIPFAKRKEMAIANGIKDFKGTAEQNRQLMALINKTGQTQAPVTTADFIKQIPFAERKAMAESMGIKNFTGTAEQNALLLKQTQMGESRPLGRSAPAMLPAKSSTPDMARRAMDNSINSYLKSRDSETETDSDNDWKKLTALGLASALGQFRPTDAEELDAAQLAPEMMALSSNTLEPVQAQTFQPLLAAPTSFSLQDQLNEITSASRAAEKMAAYNPEAAGMIAAQAYNAKNKVLGEQFRMNQAEQQRVAEQNRNVLNDAQLKNLAIFDTQYQRQEQAKSATKAQAMEAMKSIADKVAKNKLENRQLGVMENMYNYRFNKAGQAYNLNSPQFFNYAGGSSTSNSNKLAEGYEDYYNKAGERIGTRKSKDSDTGRNGAIVKAIKNL
jgi:hypothetical protein